MCRILARCWGSDKKIYVLLLNVIISSSVFAQSTVTGTITSKNGQPLSGVTVNLRGANTSALSTSSGSYAIQASVGDTLEFINVGLTRQTAVVTSLSQPLNITFSDDDISVDEVVVVGYGTQRREAVTGSVSSIGGEAMREVPSANITQALQGRLPGVQISQSSSRPGATTQIRIRGTRSLNASNDPLIVLDGIPFTGSIGDINPNDIKSIDVLKDASATAIYGSRGANGVILVTTNTGVFGQPARISYNSFQGFQNIFSKYPMMNGPEFVALRQAAGMFPNNGIDESDDVDTDWQDLMYRTGYVVSQDVGVSGGTETGAYNFGAGYYKDQGVLPLQGYNRISLRGTVDQRIGDYIRLGFNTNSNYNVTSGQHVGLGLLANSPIANPYNPDGSFKRTIQMPLNENWVSTRSIIENLSDEWLNETRAFATYNALFGEIKIPGVEGLKYRANLGLDYRQNNGGWFTGEGINNVNATSPSTAGINNSHIYHYVMENLLTYDKTFGSKHNLNLTALYSAEENQFVRSEMSGRDIPASAFQFYNIGHALGEIIVNPDGQVYEKWGLLSYMGRAMYSYDDRYMISATVRSDGSSRLARGKKWHTYPAISAGWNIGREPFMDNVTSIDMLKLRVGYGQTSNQAINPYATLGRLATRPYNFGSDNYDVGYFVSQLPNPQLGWEYSQTYNVGVDFALFNDRLSGTAEYYETYTHDLLLNLRMPGSSGVESYTANVGRTQNKGVEFALNGIIFQNKNGWTWEAGVNFYRNRNKLTQLASGQTRDESNWWFVGHPIDVIYDYQYNGLWQEGDPHLNVLEPGGNVGMIKVDYTGGFDENGVPTRPIGPDDRQIIDMQTNFMGGFNTRVAYKNFDFSVVGMFQQGGVLISTLHSASGYLNLMSGRTNNVQVDYWTPENTGARYPKPGGLMSGDNPKYGNSLGYFDASYLKIRTMTMGYNFNDSRLLESAGLDRLRLYVMVQNPFVFFSPFHRATGMDPETNSYANQNTAVASHQSRLLTIGTNAPATRTFLFGVNLTF
ncbi:TonB-dependent receptor [Sphingobacterium sp. lm-10]|uniref:SusC/RagA family TonB-linked outer membrane protein n=1 Tax=Sphingobacterium sp. lm-10 TaxID=2944904 RepID=UPI0020202198|nr:TonB-dependent receptor [Sphingobacterium sp. lm-10]MCL7986687.1 TonB-dependent receptor [Sphingobacterium sp. lm-10]